MLPGASAPPTQPITPALHQGTFEAFRLRQKHAFLHILSPSKRRPLHAHAWRRLRLRRGARATRPIAGHRPASPRPRHYRSLSAAQPPKTGSSQRAQRRAPPVMAACGGRRAPALRGSPAAIGPPRRRPAKAAGSICPYVRADRHRGDMYMLSACVAPELACSFRGAKSKLFPMHMRPANKGAL